MSIPRRSLAVLVTLATIGACLGWLTARAEAWSGHYMTNAYGSGCGGLDADATQWFQDGGRVQYWQCLPANWNQWWYANWGTTTTVQTPGPPVGPAKCLDAWPMSGYPWGYRVSVFRCNGGTQQLWYNNPATGQFRNVRSGLCLDIGLPEFDGSYVGLWPCRNLDSSAIDTQVWYLTGT